MRPLFFVLFCIFTIYSIGSQARLQRISGELQDTGVAKGRSYFSIKNSDTGRLQHIICSSEIVNGIHSTLRNSGGRKIYVNSKVKNLQLGSPLLECVNRPILRTWDPNGIQLARVRRENPKSPNPPNHYSKESNKHFVQEPNEYSKETNAHFIQKSGVKFVSGQILEADSDSGLLTIQSATRKSYLKVDPLIAKRIHENLTSMQIQNIEGRFIYDRNLGFFVGSDNSYRAK